MTHQLWSVPGMTCDHCVRAISESVGAVDGVAGVDVDLTNRTVSVTGSAADARVRAAIEDAGYEAA